MRKILLIIAICSSIMATAQKIHVGVFGGLSAYNGDLTEKIFPQKITNGAVGVSLNYELTDNIMLRAGLTHAIVGGADRFSDKASLKQRNLSFETSLLELSLLGEYYLLNLNEAKYSPYVFGGLAIYRFNPYAYNGSTNKVYLQPLSTEGQGLVGYDGRKKYSLTQLAIPLGAGVKFALGEKFRIGIEGGLRKLFTDYFDDVSKNYIDANDLLAAKGQLAVAMSYRGDEVPGGDQNYPAKGLQRGSPKNKDMYYFTGVHLTYRIGEISSARSGSGRKSRYGCPTVY